MDSLRKGVTMNTTELTGASLAIAAEAEDLATGSNFIWYDDVAERWVGKSGDQIAKLQTTCPYSDGNALDDAAKAFGVPADDFEVVLTFA